MHEPVTYQIDVRGQVEERELNAGSPIQATVTRSESATTLFTIHADQSGLIGMLRHLHARGLVLLSVTRERTPHDSGGRMSIKSIEGIEQ